MLRLKEVREKQGMTQEAVADKCGISRPAYGNIENGKRRPSVDVAKTLGELLGFDWTQFYDEKK